VSDNANHDNEEDKEEDEEDNQVLQDFIDSCLELQGLEFGDPLPHNPSVQYLFCRYMESSENAQFAFTHHPHFAG
jgi:hypothetical protein